MSTTPRQVSSKNIPKDKKAYIDIYTDMLTVEDIVKLIVIILEIPLIVFMTYMLIDTMRDK